MAEQNGQTVKAHAKEATESAREFFEKPAATIAEAGNALNDKFIEGFQFVGSQLEETAAKVTGKANSSGPAAGKAASEAPAAAAAEGAAPGAAGGAAHVEKGAGGSTSVTDKIAVAFEKPAAAVSEKASELNDKLIAGFDYLGQKLVPSKKGGEDMESGLAKFGDKIVEAVIEKPAAAISEAAAALEQKMALTCGGSSLKTTDAKAASGEPPKAAE